jgi:hypothetical protein
MWVANLGGLGREDDITKERKSRTQSRRMTIDFGDDRLLDVQHREYDLFGLDHDPFESFLVCCRPLEPMDIPTARKGLSRSRQHDAIALVVTLCVEEDATQFFVHYSIHGIEPVRTI